MKLFKLDDKAVVPSKREEDEGYDLTCIDDGKINKNYIEYRTGIAIEPPEGYFFSIRPRSSISKYDLILCNGPGTIDSGFRSEVLIRFKIVKNYGKVEGSPLEIYKTGDRIAQLILEKRSPHGEFQEVKELNELSTSIRGMGGFGSTGQ